jgi:glycosyltransferase involved in cell wall biosynthesis
MSSKNHLVSVCMITYNQEKYIEQAIEGVLRQKCDFDFELIISNDCSTDNSHQIILNAIGKNSTEIEIKYFNQDKNLGMIENFIFAYKHCKSPYTAMCEGDDYWTDILKLQKQINFLEANPDFSICFHSVDVLFQDGRKEIDFGIKGILEESESTIYDLAALGNYIHTPSVVFRKVVNNLPMNFSDSPIGDFYLWILVAKYGKIKKLKDVMSVYRYNTGNFSSSSGKDKKNKFLKTLLLISTELNNKTLEQIIENRIVSIKFSNLNYIIRDLEDITDISKGEILRKFVSIKELLKAIFYKVSRF